MAAVRAQSSETFLTVSVEANMGAVRAQNPETSLPVEANMAAVRI